jgi:vesicle coat complex subunit
MAQSNESADLLKNNNSGGSGNNNGNSNTVAKKDSVIDIKKFLQRHKAEYGKSISGLLEVLFKDQTAKESEWPKKVSDAINRQVK